MTATDQAAPVVRDRPDRSRHELLVGGALAAALAYRRRGGVRDLVHTEVAPEVEGQGLGGVLVAGVLDDARRTGARVVTTCPCVRSFLAHHRDRLDVVPDDPPERAAAPAADGTGG